MTSAIPVQLKQLNMLPTVTAQKPSFTVNFPKWWKTEKFNITPTFSDIWKRMVNSLFTLSKTQEKHEVHRTLSCTRKMPMNSLFSWKFFYSFPVRANTAFSNRFHTELLTAKATKTWTVRLLFSCSMETEVHSLHCLPKCFSVVFVSTRVLHFPSFFTQNY